MKLLVVSNMYPSADDPAFGSFVQRFVEGHVAQGIEVSLATKTRSTGLLNKFLDYLGFYYRAFLGCFSADTAYVHYPSHSAVPVILSRLFTPTRLVINFHGSDLLREGERSRVSHTLKAVVNRWAVHLADAVVVPSAYYRERLLQEFPRAEGKVLISQSSGIDSSFRVEKRAQGDNSVVVGFAGRLSPDKGVDDLERILEVLPASVTLQVAGGGNPELISRLAARFPDRFTYHGVLSTHKLVHFFNGIDVLVFPTYRETESLGLVVAEAIRCGSPVVAYEYGAAREIIQPGINGSIVKQGDTVAMARELENWITDLKQETCVRQTISESVADMDMQKVLLRLISDLERQGIYCE